MSSSPAPSTPVENRDRPALTDFRTAGRSALVAVIGFAITFISQAIVFTIWPTSDFIDPAHAGDSGNALSGLWVWLFGACWGIGFLVGVIGIGRLVTPAATVGGSVIRTIGVFGVGAMLLITGNGIAQTSIVAVRISDSGADIHAQEAALAVAQVVQNGFGYTASLLLAVWAIAGALVGRRTIGPIMVVVAIIFGLASAGVSAATGYPIGTGVFSLYFVVAAIVFLVRGRRA